jgi:transcriptional regulator EpsA
LNDLPTHAALAKPFNGVAESTSDDNESVAPASGIRGDLEQYQRTLVRSVKLRSHLEVMVWMQGDLQRYLPHDMLIAAWGNFNTGNLSHDIVSILSGVRSVPSNDAIVTPFLMQLFAQWVANERKAFVCSGAALELLLLRNGGGNLLDEALRETRSALVHGIKDERGSHDCLYVAFTGRDHFTPADCNTLTQVLPYIDHALRQVEHLPHQSASTDMGRLLAQQVTPLSKREQEILRWIAMGKTNDEIGSILELSVYTVKNNVQRVLRKLNVSNRAQAVAVLAQRA